MMSPLYRKPAWSEPIAIFTDVASHRGCAEPGYVPLDRPIDLDEGRLVSLPTEDLHALAFEILVDLEKVRDLAQGMRRNVGEVEEFVLRRIFGGHAEDLVVGVSPVEHLEHADGPDVDAAAGERRLFDQDEDVTRIAVFRQRPWNEPIITGIVHGGIQDAVEAEQTGVLVQLVLVATPTGYLDHGRDLARNVFADGEIVPGMYHGTHAMRCRCQAPGLDSRARCYYIRRCLASSISSSSAWVWRRLRAAPSVSTASCTASPSAFGHTRSWR